VSELNEPLEDQTAEMGFWDHVAELRKRLIICAITVGIGAIFGWYASSDAFTLITTPFVKAFPSGELIGTGPAEAFILRLKIAVFLGVLITTPMLFMQLWLFIAPGLVDQERKYAIPFVICTTFLFAIGVWFCIYVVLPFALTFFESQYTALGQVKPTIRISEYLSLLIKAALGFGLVFNTPVIAFILGRAGLLTEKAMLSSGRYALVGIFVISAILTPPDILTQFLMAGPLILLYGISILIVRYTGRDGI
jgi:sec-independent protein translocase protein TatC